MKHLTHTLSIVHSICIYDYTFILLIASLIPNKKTNQGLACMHAIYKTKTLNLEFKLHTQISIYMEKERERERERAQCVKIELIEKLSRQKNR